MTNQELLITIADYSRVELTPPNIEEIAEELKDFNILEFKNFVKSSLERAELQYTPKGLERFMKFVNLYKKEINAEREKNAQLESQTLEHKFYKIRNTLREEQKGGKSLKLEFIKVNGQDYFSSFEIGQLNAIGNIDYLIRLADDFKLQEKLEKNFLKMIYKKPQIAITNNRDVSKLVEVKKI